MKTFLVLSIAVIALIALVVSLTSRGYKSTTEENVEVGSSVYGRSR
jgi:hypothetical protein